MRTSVINAEVNKPYSPVTFLHIAAGVLIGSKLDRIRQSLHSDEERGEHRDRKRGSLVRLLMILGACGAFLGIGEEPISYGLIGLGFFGTREFRSRLAVLSGSLWIVTMLVYLLLWQPRPTTFTLVLWLILLSLSWIATSMWALKIPEVLNSQRLVGLGLFCRGFGVLLVISTASYSIAYLLARITYLTDPFSEGDWSNGLHTVLPFLRIEALSCLGIAFLLLWHISSRHVAEPDPFDSVKP